MLVRSGQTKWATRTLVPHCHPAQSHLAMACICALLTALAASSARAACDIRPPPAAGATVTCSGSTITGYFSSNPGVTIINDTGALMTNPGASVINVTNSQTILNRGSIAADAGSSGVFAVGSNQITNDVTGVITATGIQAKGIQVVAGGNAILNSGTIFASGQNAQGIPITAAATRSPTTA